MRSVVPALPRPEKDRTNNLSLLALGIAVAIGTAAPVTGMAQAGNATEQASEQRRYNIAGGPLDTVLNRFALASGIELSVSSELTRGKTSDGLEGSYSVVEGLRSILAGSGLDYRFTGTDSVTLTAGQDGQPRQLEPILVESARDMRGDGRAYSSDGTATAMGGDYGLAPKDTPVSSSAVSGELLEEQAIDDLREAVRNTPGVQFTGTYFNNYDNFSIRGFELPRINGYLRNGSPVVHLHQSSFVPVERIEVLKGPASILYGTVAPGGVINIQTKQPIAEPHARVTGTVGLFDDYRALVDGGNRIGSDGGAWRLVAGVRESDSFKDQAVNDEATVYGTARLPVAENTFLSGSFEITEQEITVDDGVPATDPDNPLDTAMKLPRSTFIGEREGRGEYDNNHLKVELETLLGGWETAVSYSYNWNARDVRQVRANDFGWSSPFVNDDGRTVRRYTNSFINKRLWHNGALDFANVIATGSVEHHLGIGASYRLEKTGGTGNSFVGDFSGDPTNPQQVPPIDLFEPEYGADMPFQYADPFDTRYSQFSGVYLQNVMHIGEDWVALLGLRWDEDRNRDNDQRTDALSPRAGLVYRVTGGLSVYGSYAESFEPIFGLDRNNERWDPSRGEQIEVGAKQALFNDQALLTLALYELQKVDTLVEDPDDPMFDIQGGKRRSRGVEVELAGSVTDRLDLRAGYTYTGTEILEADNNEGNRFGEIPRHRANVWAGYALTNQLRVGGGIFYTGSRYSSDANNLELDSLTVVDTFARYDISADTHVRLNIKNVFDEEYITQAGGFAYPGATGIQFGEPLNWQLQLSHAF